MNNLGTHNGEFVNIFDLAETDIFQLLMSRDQVHKSDFLKLCDDARRDLKQYRAASA